MQDSEPADDDRPSANTRDDRARWSAKARAWDRHIGDAGDRNRRLHVLPVVWRMLGDVAGLDVLDAGCGTGALAAQLAGRGARVTAIDLAPGMLAVARERIAREGASVVLAEDDASALRTVETASQDRVASVYVLQDLEDLAGAARAIARVLRPGGEAVVVVSHPCFGVPGGPTRAADGVRYHWPHPYFEPRRVEETWEGTDHESGAPIDFGQAFTVYHRPLRDYWRAFQDAGLEVVELDEPVMQPPFPEALAEDEIRHLTQVAWSLALHLRKPPPRP